MKIRMFEVGTGDRPVVNFLFEVKKGSDGFGANKGGKEKQSN